MQWAHFSWLLRGGSGRSQFDLFIRNGNFLDTFLSPAVVLAYSTKQQHNQIREAPMRKLSVAIFLVFAITIAARADEVTSWNETLFRSAVVANSSALNMTRFAALVQAAVFDAVNGIERRYTPIHVNPAAPAGASSSAAAMQAAYSILSRLYGQGGVFTPNQQATLDADLAASLARIAMHDSPLA